MVMTLVATTKEWGLRPSDLGLCRPEQDLALMAGYQVAVGQIMGYERQLAEEEMERQRRKAR